MMHLDLKLKRKFTILF